MLDYIKQQLALRSPQPDVTFEEMDVNQQTDELVTEYAHIFQELDDLTVEGEDAHRDRPISLDIPIEDDVELDTVELNLMDNRLVDVPMDVTTNMESFVEQMKTFEDFYQEACEFIKPFVREGDDMVHLRRMEYAQEHYDVYHKQMVDEGLFGFEPVSIADKIVPTSIMESFGILDDSNPNQKYMVKMPVMFELTGEQTIYRSQLDALKVANANAIYEQFTDVLQDKLGINNVWDVVTPKRVIVPRTLDDYELIVEFDYDKSDQPIYEGWAYRRKPSERDIEVHSYPHESIKDIVNNIIMMNKRDYVHQESYIRSITPDRWNLNTSNIYQESKTTVQKGDNYRLLGYLIGGAAVSLATLGIATVVPGATVTMLGLLDAAATGGIGGLIAGHIFYRVGFDKGMGKNITKKIAKVNKFLQTGDDGSATVDKIGRLKKYVKDLRKEIVSDLAAINEGKLTKRYQSGRTIETFTELRDACGDVISTIKVEKDPSNKDCLQRLIVAMEKTMRLIASPVKTNDTVAEAFSIEEELGDIFQEAIDFGYPDETTEAAKQNQPGTEAPSNDPSTPTVTSDNNTENTDQAQPAADTDANADNMDQQASTDDTTNTDNTPDEGENKLPVETNDVSDEIAKNVSDQTTDTQQNVDTGVDANGDINIDDTDNSDNSSTDDLSANINFDNIDNSIDDLDNAGDQTTGDETIGDPANMDINTMSIDDIMAQAAEKLKSMPIEQVKQFLSDGTATQEAYTQDPQRGSARQFYR